MTNFIEYSMVNRSPKQAWALLVHLDKILKVGDSNSLGVSIVSMAKGLLPYLLEQSEENSKKLYNHSRSLDWTNDLWQNPLRSSKDWDLVVFGIEALLKGEDLGIAPTFYDPMKQSDFLYLGK